MAAEDLTGAVVRYHGSHTRAHGEYTVFGLCRGETRYRLGHITATGGLETVVTDVRRSSITVIAQADDVSHF